MARPRPMAGGEVEGEDRHRGQLGDHPQHQEGGDDRQHADAHRQPGGDDAAEDHHQEEQGDRDGHRLGLGQVVLDRAADLAEDLGLAADPHVELAGLAGEGGGEGLDAGVDRVLVAADAGQDQGLAAVVAAQGRDVAQAPVGDGLLDRRPRRPARR